MVHVKTGGITGFLELQWRFDRAAGLGLARCRDPDGPTFEVNWEGKRRWERSPIYTYEYIISIWDNRRRRCYRYAV